jgi:hypothetical protein
MQVELNVIPKGPRFAAISHTPAIFGGIDRNPNQLSGGGRGSPLAVFAVSQRNIRQRCPLPAELLDFGVSAGRNNSEPPPVPLAVL